MKLEKFVLNRANFRSQVLKSKATEDMLLAKLGPGAEPRQNYRHARVRVRLYGSMEDEAKNGTLSRRLGGGG